MNIGLAVTITQEINSKSKIIHSLSDDLKLYFQNRNYGQGIKSLTIGIVCVSPGFEKFFKDKKAKYTKGRKESIIEGIPLMEEDSFEYTVKLEYETFKNANDKEIRKILAVEILASLVVFEKFRSKIKDFDLDHFIMDLEEYFKSQNLIY